MPNDAMASWSDLHGDAFDQVKVLVTGGAGFIGSHVTAALLELGARITVVDDLSEGDLSKLSAGDVDLRQNDLLDDKALAEAMEGCRYVFHLAAKVSVPRSVETPRLYHDVDATGTLNVMEAARQKGVKRVVYSASSSAYGDQPTLPKHEEMAPKPMSPYAASKLSGEHILRSYAAVYDVDAVSLRYFNIFGPRQNANSAYAGVIAAFARDLLAGETPTIYGDGSASRDFTHVANAVHANLLAARHNQPLVGEVFNVGTARRVTVLELANEMIKLSGQSGEPQFAEPRAGDVPHSLASIDKSRRVLAYDVQVDFEDGLKQTMDWYAGRVASASAAT